MKAFNKKLKSELEIETINKIEMIKKELDNVPMQIKKNRMKRLQLAPLIVTN